MRSIRLKDLQSMRSTPPMYGRSAAGTRDASISLLKILEDRDERAPDGNT
jgi:hypothetical protein